MPVLMRRRPKSSLPLTESFASKENGARRFKNKRPSLLRFKLLRYWRRITISLTFLVLLLKNKIRWIYKNRYLYLGCPEIGFWLRQPFDDAPETPPHLMYLTAKFGPYNGTFASQIYKQVNSIKRLNVLPYTTDIISYADLPLEFQQDPIWKSHVDSLYNRGQQHIHPRRGGGYWFWKPLLLRKHLLQLQHGDFLIYSDPDMLDFFSWLPLLLERMVEWNANLALYQLPYLEQEWTKRDVYEEFCPMRDMQHDQSGQYAGGHLVLRKDNATLQFLQDWINAMKNFHWVSDEPSIKPNLACFIEHRHDQSLLSLLLKCKYGEPHKRPFPWTCLQTWTLTTFRIE